MTRLLLTTNKQYEGPDILAELDAGNNLTASYTHSPLRPDDILGAKFTSYATPIGALSEGQVLAASAGNVYYLKDHLNTINEITDAVGDIVQKMDYSAFGVLRSIKDSNGNEVDFTAAPVRSSFTYTGREFEPELGMYYYRARYYDPNTGRFLQQDLDPGKLASPSTFLSKYIYAGNNPVMFGDPSGLSWLSELVDTVMGAGHNVIANLGAAFDNLVKDKTFQIICVIIAAALIGPAVAGLFTLTGWTAVAVSAVVGGLVGGISYVGLGLGTFAEGFALGALAGGLSYYAQYGIADGIAGSTGNLAMTDCLKQKIAGSIAAGALGTGSLMSFPSPVTAIIKGATLGAGIVAAAYSITYGIGCGSQATMFDIIGRTASLKSPISTPINDKMNHNPNMLNVINENSTSSTNQYVTFNWGWIEKWADFIN